MRKAQKHYFGRSVPLTGAPERDELTGEEISFIQARDSFYIATISQSGWPYIQHRGGHAGFLRVLNPRTLAFADYSGNRHLDFVQEVAEVDVRRSVERIFLVEIVSLDWNRTKYITPRYTVEEVQGQARLCRRESQS